MIRCTLLLLSTLALLACSDREPDATDTDAGDTHADAGDTHTDAGPPDTGTGDPDAGEPDAGACTLDCPELPTECYYDGQDCEAGTCGTPVCPEPDEPCGGLFHPVCGGDEYCDYTEPGACGLLDETGTCRPRPTDCPTDEVAPVCSCDGNTYDNECLALMAGRDVAHEGECPAPDPCRSLDAWGLGDCTDSQGWKWTGVDCEEVIGCTCDGTECFRLEATEADCDTAWAACAPIPL